MIKVLVYYCRKKWFDNVIIYRLMFLNVKYKFIKIMYWNIYYIDLNFFEGIICFESNKLMILF